MCKKSYMFHIFIVFNIFWLKVNRLKAKKVCHVGMTHFLLISGGASTKMRCLCC